MKKIIGIYDGHNASASLLLNGTLQFSVEEEKFTKIKNHDMRNTDVGAPINAINFCLSKIDYNCNDFVLALSEPSFLVKKSLFFFNKSLKNKSFSKRKNFVTNQYRNFDTYKKFIFDYQSKRINNITKHIKKYIKKPNIYMVPHHEAHAASAYYTSYFNKSLIFSFDGRGDALSGSVYIGNKGKIKLVKEFDFIDSLGHFYSAITVACGFKAIRHEGKITGLAAHGVVQTKLLSKFKLLINYSDGEILSKIYSNLILGPYPDSKFRLAVDKVKKLVKGFKVQDIACTAQFHSEQIIVKLVKYYSEKYGINNFSLAGGLFANVLINKKISELSNCSKLFIHPAMSDSGISFGAAVSYYYNHAKNKYYPKKNFNIYTGPKISTKNIEKFLLKKKLNYLKFKNPEIKVAELLSKKKIIARCVDSLEYGPRALGNRSILFHAGDKSTNLWLNNQLKRSEFMPFAPLIIDKYSKILLKIQNKCKIATKYMTIAVPTTNKMKKLCPAVIHVDGTVRPQVLSRKDNPKLYKLLKEYNKLTKIPCLINTSFNLHDFPIVSNEFDAVDSFIKSKIDYLQLNNYIISKSGKF